MAAVQKITPNLWFDKQAEEAANFYVSIFNHASLGSISRYGKEGHEIHGMAEGSALTVAFELEGQAFLALNGGPQFTFNEAISFIVNCDDQKEVDYFWEKLSAGGDPAAQQCGWLKDKYGVSWQIVPSAVSELLSGPDAEKSGRVFAALMPMKKLDIATLKQAYEGG